MGAAKEQPIIRRWRNTTHHNRLSTVELDEEKEGLGGLRNGVVFAGKALGDESVSERGRVPAKQGRVSETTPIEVKMRWWWSRRQTC